VIGSYAELVRLPAVVTVPGDALAAGGRNPLPSVALYWAGMAANDLADRRIDAIERPERPIPSGRISASSAFLVAAGLTAAGLIEASRSGRMRSGLGVAAVVWTYDLWAKNTVLGPAVMSAARGMDVVLGSARVEGRTGVSRRTRVAATSIAVHTLGVTTLSRGEVHGGSRGVSVVFAVCAAAAGAVAASRVRSASGLLRRTVLLASLARYGEITGRAALDVYESPDAETVRRSTRAALVSVTLLQAALCAEDALAGAVVLGLSPRLVPLLARTTAGDVT